MDNALQDIQTALLNEMHTALQEVQQHMTTRINESLHAYEAGAQMHDNGFKIPFYADTSSNIVARTVNASFSGRNVTLQQVASGILRREGSRLGRRLGTALFDTSTTGAQPASAQLSAQLLEGLLGGRRNR